MLCHMALFTHTFLAADKSSTSPTLKGVYLLKQITYTLTIAYLGGFSHGVSPLRTTHVSNRRAACYSRVSNLTSSRWTRYGTGEKILTRI